MKLGGLSVVTLTLAWAVSLNLARSAGPPREPESTSIGYASVAEALAALKAKPGVKFSTEDGMTIARDLDGPTPTVWTFFPKTHPAYPSVIKRAIANTADGAFMETNVRCEASKEICDKYFGGK